MPEPKTLASALVAFQAEMPTVAKAQTGQYGNYAGLADVTHAAAPVLTRHGLAFTCLPRRTEAGDYDLVGRLLHTSGESLEGVLPIQGTTAQQIGSSLTYGRRYLFGCLTGVVTDDDDDGAAASTTKKRATRTRKADPDADPWADTPPRESTARQVTAEQLALMGVHMKTLNITDRDSALLYVSDVVSRPITTRNDLTRAEASRVIDALAADIAAQKAGAS